MRAAVSRMHIDNASRQYMTASDEQGRPRNETLANLSALPDHVLSALGRMLRGATLVDAGEAFEVKRSVPHGGVAAAHVTAAKLGLRSLLGPPCRERDIAYA